MLSLSCAGRDDGLAYCSEAAGVHTGPERRYIYIFEYWKKDHLAQGFPTVAGSFAHCAAAASATRVSLWLNGDGQDVLSRDLLPRHSYDWLYLRNLALRSLAPEFFADFTTPALLPKPLDHFGEAVGPASSAAVGAADPSPLPDSGYVRANGLVVSVVGARAAGQPGFRLPGIGYDPGAA